MTWWILEQRDSYRREGEHVCQFDILDPHVHVIEPGIATCSRCGGLLEPGFWRPPCRAAVQRWAGHKWLPARACGDLIHGPSIELVISGRARRAFDRDGLRGFDAFTSLQLTPRSKRAYFVARRPSFLRVAGLSA